MPLHRLRRYCAGDLPCSGRASGCYQRTTKNFSYIKTGARWRAAYSWKFRPRTEALSDSVPKPEVSLVDPKDLGLGTRQANLITSLSFTVPHAADETWAALEDIENVARCMPGASLDEHSTDGRLAGRVTVKIGPIATNFIGAGQIVRDSATRRGVLYGSGRDRLSGTAVRAEVSYAVIGESISRIGVDVTVRALLAGTLAQFGRSGIVQDLVARITEKFSQRLQRSLTDPETIGSSEASLNATAVLLQVITTRLRSLRDRVFPGASKRDN